MHIHEHCFRRRKRCEHIQVSDETSPLILVILLGLKKCVLRKSDLRLLEVIFFCFGGKEVVGSHIYASYISHQKR